MNQYHLVAHSLKVVPLGGHRPDVERDHIKGIKYEIMADEAQWEVMMTKDMPKGLVNMTSDLYRAFRDGEFQRVDGVMEDILRGKPASMD
jgi:hypothetical protein